MFLADFGLRRLSASAGPGLTYLGLFQDAGYAFLTPPDRPDPVHCDVVGHSLEVTKQPVRIACDTAGAAEQSHEGLLHYIFQFVIQ